MADHFRRHGVAWRPHAKAFKTPAIAHALLQAGAIGLTVAKVSEAEIFASAGVRDILIAHLVVGPPKVARLAALQRHATVRATVDHPDQIPPLASAARSVGVEIGLLVDVDIGMSRTGVDSPASALNFARCLHKTPGLRFDGIMGYEGHTLSIRDDVAKDRAIRMAIDRLIEARDTILRDGLECPIVSAGGSGSYQFTAGIPGVTEVQAGGGIFACRYYTETCRITGHRPAISLLARVVSRPERSRVVLDIGVKSVSSHCEPPVLKHPEISITRLSAEHACLKVPDTLELPIGSKVEVIPGYSDFTFVLHDRVLGHRAGRVESSWELWARGLLQ
jgi:D-serine deaminase-like pyridoxal phosphate-dependent protein